MVYIKNILLVIFVVSLFSSCVAVKQERLGEVFQSNSAVEIKKDYKAISKFILQFKEKLDKRNPNAFDENLSNEIYTQIDNLQNNISLQYNGKDITSYKGYLQIAFSKDDIKNRNDYLIIGLYKLLYDSYDVEDSYKLTAFSYDKEKLQRLYSNLQILSWKIKVDKDLSDNYLFLTWQNNWQIELEKRLKNGEELSHDELQKLKFIQENKESMLDPSNFSFEVLLTQMIDSAENSLRALGEEPKELTVKAMFLFL